MLPTILGKTNVVLGEVHERQLPFCEALLHQAAAFFVAISGTHTNAMWEVFQSPLCRGRNGNFKEVEWFIQVHQGRGEISICGLEFKFAVITPILTIVHTHTCIHIHTHHCLGNSRLLK